FVPDALWVAAYGGIWLMAATAATQWGVTHMEAGRASILIVMELVTAVGSAMLIAGERLEPMEWFGAVLILAATLIEATRATSPAEAEPEQTPFS
ncbi:MAG: DMT family transporter, partial [Gammaproteobacteria bacterium]|nr:DMT family transporter [Gammaproteobacteria bacterium]MDX5503671.1 DMT family transporter [Halomonas sp.]